MPPTYTPLVKVNEKVLYNYSDADLDLLVKFEFISKEAYDKEMNFRKKEREKTPNFRVYKKNKIIHDTEHNRLLVPRSQRARKEPEPVDSSSADEDAPAAKPKEQPKSKASPKEKESYTDRLAKFNKQKAEFEKEIDDLKKQISSLNRFKEKNNKSETVLKAIDVREKKLREVESKYKEFLKTKPPVPEGYQEKEKSKETPPKEKPKETPPKEKPKEAPPKKQSVVIQAPPQQIIGNLDPNYNNLWLPNESVEEFNKRRMSYFAGLTEDDLKHYSDYDLSELAKNKAISRDWYDQEIEDRKQGRAKQPFYKFFPNRFGTWPQERISQYNREWGNRILQTPPPTILSKTNYDPKFTGARFPGESLLDMQKRYVEYSERLQKEDLKYFSDDDLKNGPIFHHMPNEWIDDELKFREETRKINPRFRKYPNTLYTWSEKEKEKLRIEAQTARRKQAAEQFLSQLKAGKKFKVVKGSVKTITPADRIKQLSKQLKSLKKKESKPVQTQTASPVQTPEDPRPKENIPVVSNQSSISVSESESDFIPNADEEDVNPLDIGEQPYYIITPENEKDFEPEGQQAYDLLHRLERSQLIPASYKPLGNKHGLIKVYSDGTRVWSSSFSRLPGETQLKYERERNQNPAPVQAQSPPPEDPRPRENIPITQQEFKLAVLPGAKYEIVKDGKKELTIIPDSRNHKVPDDKSKSWNDLIIARYKGQIGFAAQLKNGTVVWSKKIQDIPVLSRNMSYIPPPPPDIPPDSMFYIPEEPDLFPTFDNRVAFIPPDTSPAIRVPKSELLNMKFNPDDPHYQPGYFPVQYWKDGKTMYGYLLREPHNRSNSILFYPWDRPKNPLNPIDEHFLHKQYEDVHDAIARAKKLKGKIDDMYKLDSHKKAMFASDIRDRVRKFGMEPENIFDLSQVQLLPQTKFSPKDTVVFTPAVYKGREGYLYRDPYAKEGESKYKWHVNPSADEFNSKISHLQLIKDVKRAHEVAGTQYMMLPPGAEGTPSENAKKAAETNININVNTDKGIGTGSEPPPSGPQKVDAGTDAATPTKEVATGKDQPEGKQIEVDPYGNHGKPKIVEVRDEDGKLLGIQEMRYSTFDRPWVSKFHKYEDGKYKRTFSFNPPKDLDKDVPLMEKIKKSTENTFKGYWDVAYDPKTHGEEARKTVGAIASGIADASMNLQGPDTYGYVAGNVASGLINTEKPVMQIAGAALGAAGLGYQIHRSRKIARQLKKAERAQLMNEARNYTWQNSNALQAMNSLRTSLKMQHKQQQILKQRNIYEQASIRNRLGAMKEMISMMTHNEKNEAAERQRYIDEHSRANYEWGVKRRDEAAKKFAQENEDKKAITESQTRPLKYMQDLTKGTQYEGPMNQMANYELKFSPNPNPQRIKDNFFSYLARGANFHNDYLVRKDNQYTRKEVSLRDYQNLDELGNDPEYLDAMSNEGPTWLAHKDLFDAFVAKNQAKRKQWETLKGIATAAISHAYDLAKPYLDAKLGNLTKFIDVAIDAIQADPNVPERYRQALIDKIKHDTQLRKELHDRLTAELKEKEKKNNERINKANEALNIDPNVGEGEDKIEKEEKWYNSVYNTVKGVLSDAYASIFGLENERYKKKITKYLVENTNDPSQWGPVISSIVDDNHYIGELMPENNEQLEILKSLKNTAGYADRYQSEDDINNAVDAKMILDQELHKADWTKDDMRKGSWHENMHKAFIENDQQSKNYLAGIGIHTPKDFISRRNIISENFLTKQEVLDPNTYEAFENASMMLTPDEFNEQIIKPINTYKVQKKIDLGKSIGSIFLDLGKALNEARKIRHESDPQQITHAINNATATRSAGDSRVLQYLMPEKNYPKIFPDGQNQDPKYVEADIAMNHQGRIFARELGSIGFTDADLGMQLLKDINEKFMPLSDGTHALDVDNYLPENMHKRNEIKQKAAMLPNYVNQWLIEHDAEVVQKNYMGKEYFADETDTLQRNAARIRKTNLSFINSKFKKPESQLTPVELRQRKYQVAAALTAIEDPENGQATVDALDGIKFLDNMPASTIVKLGAKARKKGFYTQMTRHKFGEDIERETNKKFDAAIKEYEEVIGKHQTPHRTEVVYSTPFLLEKNYHNKQKNIKLLRLKDDGEALDHEIDEVFMDSPMGFDPSNQDMVNIRNGIDIMTFPKKGEGIRVLNVPGYKDVFGYTNVLENGQESHNVIWKGHYRYPFHLNWSDVSPRKQKTQKDIDRERMVLAQRNIAELPNQHSGDMFYSDWTLKERNYGKIADDTLTHEHALLEQRKQARLPKTYEPEDPAVKAMRKNTEDIINRIAADRRNVDYEYRKAHGQLTTGEKAINFGKGFAKGLFKYVGVPLSIAALPSVPTAVGVSREFANTVSNINTVSKAAGAAAGAYGIGKGLSKLQPVSDAIANVAEDVIDEFILGLKGDF